MEAMTAVVGDRGEARLTRVRMKERTPGWARLRVLLAGICRTDVYAADGRLPLPGPTILGHELVGEVEDVDPASELSIGDRVTVFPLMACGRCAACARSGRCSRPRMLGVDLDGAFAEHLLVPVASLRRVPVTLSLRRAAYLEPLAAALAVTQAPIRVDQAGIVLGAGRIADLTSRILRARGFELAEEPGAERDGAFDFVIEASGTEEGLARAIDLVVPGGVVVLKSRPPRPLALDVARAVKADLTLACVSYGSFDEAARLAADLPIEDLLGDVYPLARFDAAMVRTREEPLGPKLFLSPGGA